MKTSPPRFVVALLVVALLVVACADPSAPAGAQGGGSPQAAPGPTAPVPSSAKALTAFWFDGVNNHADFDETNNIIQDTLDQGTDVHALVANFTTTGVSVSARPFSTNQNGQLVARAVTPGDFVVQHSGVTANDFSTSWTYRVTAEDGSTADYIVEVLFASQPEQPVEGPAHH